MTARNMDLIITGIEVGLDHGMAKVWYGFPRGDHGIVHADIYPESKFDVSQLQVGHRYYVTTKEMKVDVWYPKKQMYVTELKYVWVTATHKPPKAPLAKSMTAKEREKRERLASKPLADDGSLFQW